MDTQDRSGPNPDGEPRDGDGYPVEVRFAGVELHAGPQAGNFFIRRPIFAMVISIVVMLCGGLSLPFLPVEQTPDITPPTVAVSANYPGASASVLAETVAQPIEEEVNGVQDMIYMSSTCNDDGSYELIVTFEVGTDVDMANVLVQNRVSVATPKLPEEVKREGVKVEKRSTAMVLMVNLIAKEGYEQRYDEIYLSNYIGQNIKDELARVPGVGKVTVMGAKDYGMRIWLNPNKLKARNITTMDVVNAIKEQNVQVAAGQIGAPPTSSGQNFQYTINTLGRLENEQQFEDMILKVGEQGRTLRLKDVASVELGAQSYNWEVRLNNAPSIAVAIYQLPGSNSLQVAQGIRSEMQRLKNNFPAGIDYAIAYDTTTFVTASIYEVVETLFVAVLLVVLTVYVFLQDWRATLVPAAAIPVALIGTFAVMLGMGMSINTLSLFGIVLAIGIVVDDAIVVVENTMRIIDEEGLSSQQATAKAMSEVTGPVIATTLVLLAVFVPTSVMGGITGRLYQQFAITISVATVFSSINALTLSPALCGLLLRPTAETRNSLPFLLKKFFGGFNHVFDRTTAGYMGVVGKMLRLATLSMLPLAAVFVLMVVGFLRIPGGFLPDEDQGYFIINAQLPDGATLERTREVMDQIEQILDDTPAIADVIAITGYSGLDSLATTNAGTFFVILEPWDKRSEPSLHVGAVVAGIQPKLAAIQEAVAFAFLPPPITGLGNAGGFEMRIEDKGNAGFAQLQQVAADVAFTANQNPITTRVNSNFRATVPQLYLEVDRVKAKKLNIPLQNIFHTLQAYLGSAYVNDFNKFGKTYKVMIQADYEFRRTVEDIQQLNVRDADGHMIPLSTLLTVSDVAGPKTIYRYKMYPAATITGQPRGGYSSGQAIDAMEQVCESTLPQSMGYEWSGITYQQIVAGNQAPVIFSLAVVFVFLFLAAQYESWTIPLAVILSVPLAIFGALLATAVRQYDNNVYTQIGLVLLIGLSTKSAILIVEFAKQRREQGHSIFDAASGAAQLRFRAILMTALSFILGVIPLVIASGAGAGSRRALGTAVFGGMTLATVLGVFFIPLLYFVIQNLTEFAFGPPVAAPAATPLEKEQAVPSKS